MPTLLEEKTRQFKKRSIIITCCLVALFVGVVPAYAGIGDILMSIFGWLVSTICQFILGILETIAAVFLTAMSIDYDELQQMHVLSAFASFAPVIRILSTTIAGVILLWQLLTVFFGPYLGTKQNTSTGNIVARALIFIPLTFAIQPLAEGALRMFQDVYASLLNDWYAQSGTASLPSLSEAFTNAFGGFGNFFSQVGAPIPGILANELAEIASILVSCALLILIMWNYLKFLLEMTQRFVVMIVYVYLSPLAAACGVSPSGVEITKKSLSVFISSGVLWLLNVWCIGIASGLFNSLDYATGNATNFLVWALVTYGFLKIIQQLDDIFNAVGATNVKLSGDPLSDLLGMGSAFHTLGDVVKNGKAGLQNFGENGLFSGKGSSPNSPVTPNATSGIKKPPVGDALVKGATQAAAGVKGAITGEVSPTVAAQMLKSGTKTAAGGVAGAVAGNNIVRGIRKTGENIRTRVGGAVSEAHTMQDNMMKASMNGALSRSTSQERAEAMKALAADQPQVLNSDAVKAHMGEAMGLAENQKVAGLSVDKDGNLSATVATQTANGVTLSKVSGLNNMDTNAPVQGGSAQPASATYSASQISDPARSVATATYTGVDGKTHQAEVTRTSGESLDGKTAMFTVTSDDGRNSAFNAPANMTTEEVGAVFTGSASPETMAKYQAGTDASDPKQSMSGAHTTLGVNTDISGSSIAGTPIENSPDSKFSVGGITMARTDVGGMNQGKDVWTGYDSQGNSVGTVEVPQGTSARQVADMVVNGGQDKGGIREFTEAAGISGYTSSDVSFSAQPTKVADANSPDTSFSVGGVTMSRTDAGSNGSDVWTGYNAKGESIGTMEVPQGASAQQVADMVVSGGGSNDSVREFTQTAGVTGFSRSDVSFEPASPAPADASSPDTSFSVGGVTMSRTDAGSNGSDVWTGYNAKGESVGTVEVPQGSSAQQVADMVISSGSSNDSIREFAQSAGVTGFSRSDVSFEPASPAPADASSPDTNFSVGGVTMSRTDAGSNGSDVWTGYNAKGESIGTVEVPQGASAQQVADMVVSGGGNNDSVREFTQAAGVTGFSRSDVSFEPASPAPADASSPDTSFSVGGVTMSRTDAGSNGSDVWTGYDSQGNSVGTVEVPQGASAQQVADMVVSGGNSNDSIREFAQAAGVTGFSHSDVSFETASPAPADANSPDTSFSVGGVTMSRTDAGSNGSDVWTGYNTQGESVGSVEVPQGTSAQQVADMVVHSHDSDGSGAREFAQSTGINAMDNPDVTFAPNPEAKSVSFAGEHDNGTNWSPEFKMGFRGTGEDASPDFRYSYQNESGETVVARAVVSRLDDLEMPPENGKVGYMYANNHGNTGRIYLDANITPEQLAAALATENGGGIEGIEEIRKELGIRESYTADEGKQFRKALELARRAKKGPLNSADNPVGKGEKN